MTPPNSRPYQPADAESVAAIINAIDAEVGRPAAITAAQVHDFVAGVVVSPETDSRVVADDAGNLVASVFVTTPPPGGFRVDLRGGVHPKARGQGIGRALLGWQLARAEEIHATVAPDATWEAHADVSQRQEAALALFSRSGLRPTRYWFDMTAATSGAPDLPVADGLALVGYRAGLAAAVHEAHMAAFADHWGFQHRPFDSWSAVTTESAGFNAGLSVLAMAGAEVAGYLLAYDDAIADRIYVGQLGVRREWRRRGVAGAMLARLLRLAADAGRSTAALDVDAASQTGAVGVYERVGFRTHHTSVTCVRPL